MTFIKLSPFIPTTLNISIGNDRIINRNIFIFRVLNSRLSPKNTSPSHSTFKIAVWQSSSPKIFGENL